MGKYKRIRFLLILATILLFTASVHAASQATRNYPLGVKSVEKMISNGEFEIYVLSQDEWQQAGKIAFDKFFRERELDLSGFLPDNRGTKVKVIQKGGGAAHIDSVLLGGTPPVAVEGIQDGLKKLSQKDFDVADAFGKEILITFPETAKDSVLRLTARVENIVISKTPFQFPIANLHKKMDANSAFYNYKMNTENILSPIFKEFSLTGSGHPSGYTYGWVSNDDKNLYVKIDFTPDNTMDGDKDYAKVYVKTDVGLREFKVSVSDRKWGKPDFTYTDKVIYQHKTYDFIIPLKEIEMQTGDKASEILLAFAAYGTASTPGVEYCPSTDRYLIAYDTNGDIYGQFVNSDGTPYGTEFPISNAPQSQYFPSVAFDSVNQRYLIVWSDYRNSETTGLHIYGQLIDIDGNLLGPASDINFVISNATDYQSDASVAYDSVNQRYLVAWSDNRNSAITQGDIYGQLIDKDGNLLGPASDVNFVISNATDYQSNPSVAYDNVNQRYLVAWHDGRNSAATGYDIYGQLLDKDGNLLGPASDVNFVISNAAADQYSPSIAYDNANQRYLVAWNALDDIYGQLVNKDGNPYGTASDVNFVISNDSAGQYSPTIAYDGTKQRYLVVWTDYRNLPTPGADIYGRLIHADGTPDGGDFSVTSASDHQENPKVAYNSTCQNFLVAYWSNSTIDYSIVGPCSNICLLGDINSDSMLDISDVILTLRMALGLDQQKPCPCPPCW